MVCSFSVIWQDLYQDKKDLYLNEILNLYLARFSEEEARKLDNDMVGAVTQINVTIMDDTNCGTINSTPTNH